MFFKHTTKKKAEMLCIKSVSAFFSFLGTQTRYLGMEQNKIGICAT